MTDATHERFRKDSLRARWKALKRSAVAETFMADRMVSQEVKGILGSRLAPLLQKLEREFNRYPDHDPAVLRSVGQRAERVFTVYAKRLDGELGEVAPSTNAWLRSALAELRVEVNQRIDWYARNPEPKTELDVVVEPRFEEP